MSMDTTTTISTPINTDAFATSTLKDSKRRLSAGATVEVLTKLLESPDIQDEYNDVVSADDVPSAALDPNTKASPSSNSNPNPDRNPNLMSSGSVNAGLVWNPTSHIPTTTVNRPSPPSTVIADDTHTAESLI